MPHRLVGFVVLIVGACAEPALANPYREACESLIWRDESFHQDTAQELSEAVRYLATCHPLFKASLDHARSASEVWFALGRPTGYCVPPKRNSTAASALLWDEWRHKITRYREAAESVDRERRELELPPPATQLARERIARRILTNLATIRASASSNAHVKGGAFHEGVRLAAAHGHEMLFVYQVPDETGWALDQKFLEITRVLEMQTARELVLIYLARNLPEIIRNFDLTVARMQDRLVEGHGVPSTADEDALRAGLKHEVEQFREALTASLGTLNRRPPPPKPVTPTRPATPEPPLEDLDTMYKELYRDLEVITEVLADAGGPLIHAVDLDPDGLDLGSNAAVAEVSRRLGTTRTNAFVVQTTLKDAHRRGAEVLARVGTRAARIAGINDDPARVSALSNPDRRTLRDATVFAPRARDVAEAAVKAVSARLDVQAERLVRLAEIQLGLIQIATALANDEPTELEIENVRNTLRKLKNL